MSFLHGHSNECMKSELDIFELPLTQTTIENSQWVHHRPFSALSDSGPLEFVVSGSDMYLDLSHTMLSLRVELSTVEGANAEIQAHNPGVVNNFLHSLFNQVDVFLNGKLVSPSSNAYPYRAYIENLLNYGSDAQKSHLTSVLWFRDTSNKMDDLGNGNLGLVERRKYIKKTKTTDLLGHIHADVFNQNKYIISNTELRVRLVRSQENFIFLSEHADSFHIKIIDAALLVRRVQISPGVLLANAKALTQTSAKYPLTRVEVKTFSLHTGIHGEMMDNVILGQLPKRIVLGFVNNKAYNGDKSLNPFNFQHYNINYLSLFLDGA